MPRIDSSSVLWKEVDGTVVVLLTGRSHFVEFNKVGSAIWKFLAQGYTTGQIVDEMAENYDVSREKLTLDVNQFIGRMTVEGILAA